MFREIFDRFKNSMDGEKRTAKQRFSSLFESKKQPTRTKYRKPRFNASDTAEVLRNIAREPRVRFPSKLRLADGKAKSHFELLLLQSQGCDLNRLADAIIA